MNNKVMTGRDRNGKPVYMELTTMGYTPSPKPKDLTLWLFRANMVYLSILMTLLVGILVWQAIATQ